MLHYNRTRGGQLEGLPDFSRKILRLLLSDVTRRGPPPVAQCTIKCQFACGGGAKIQLLEKRHVATEMYEDSWEGNRIDGEGLEPMNVGDHQSERAIANFA